MDSRRVGILGAGQLGRMMVEAAHRLNISTVLLDTLHDAPAKQVNALHPHISGSFADADSVLLLAEQCDIITAEIEHVDTTVLSQLEDPAYLCDKLGGKRVDVQPVWSTIRTIQDKYLQKKRLIEGGVATAEVLAVENPTEQALRDVGIAFGYPYMLKSRTLAYDGRGNFAVMREEQVGDALKALGKRPLYAERWAHFKMELAVMVVRAEGGVVRGYPVAETVHEDSILRVCYIPARGISEKVLDEAKKLAEKAVALFPGKGVFGVEMFLMEDDSLLINELAPRPHNSGHYTIDACPTSQFEIHLRAILDLPVPEAATKLSTSQTSAIMVNILGGTEPWGHLALAKKALLVPGATVHLYGKGPARPDRKMGHITIVGGEGMQKLQETAAELVKDAFTNTPAVPSTTTTNTVSTTTPSSALPAPRNPIVSIIMGSDSDLPQLIPACKTLKHFDIPFECTIVSAHRTPARMVAFAHSAASRGIRAIIAAAGGAAHLPGMVASETTLPVIGVPIRGSQLAGVDSVLSILQMPRGVPVATVGINNGVNAALLAARMVGVSDALVREKYEKYVKDMEEEVLRKVAKLEKSEGDVAGWEVYLQGGK